MTKLVAGLLRTKHVHFSAARVDISKDMAYARTYARKSAVSSERHVKLFKNGRSQAVRIPREFELPGEDAIMRKDGERLTIEPTPPKSLLAVLATLSPLEDDFPPISELMVVSTTAVLHIDAAIAEPFCPSKIPSGQSVMRWPRTRCPF